MSEAARPILLATGISKSYRQGDTKLEVLKDLSLVIKPGETVALVGPSGSGKTTLLQLVGLLDKADGGSILLDHEECVGAGEARRTELRRRKLGFVYQFHHLLPEFSALENVMLPLMIQGSAKKQATQEAEAWLGEVGVAHRKAHRPSQLSGGEQQRVAIARALAVKPALLIADEPTGNLDVANASHVFDLLLRLARERGTAALIATHNPELAKRLDYTVTLKDGKLVSIP